jgi:predicted YcjX-like family ATPase
VKLTTWTDQTADALRNAGAFMSDLVTPTIRLGVTGLSRSGKTVFITALVRNLVTGGRLPFFLPQAERRILRCYLEPQPDDNVPRFAYEDHLRQLTGEPPEWPDGTKRISQLRVTIEYVSKGLVRKAVNSAAAGALGPSKLHLDIVDYPGEWLVDLALMDLDFAAWSRQALEQARERQRHAASEPFLGFLIDVDGKSAADEQVALKGAQQFTRYLHAARADEPALSVLTPGRFLMPGDLEGSPLLTFFPLDVGDMTDVAKGSFAALLARRYESYKAHVVKPFFRDHFSRLDRQIVLMDALSALNHGADGLGDLSRAMETVLAAFRPGANTWMSSIFRRRVDRIVFAATKADHLNHQSHDRLESLLRALAGPAIERAAAKGADVKVLALAALRATREAEAKSGNERLPCIVGTPLKGERIGSTIFDGKTETALFPGDLPDDPSKLLSRSGKTAKQEHDIRAVKFRPPKLTLQTGAGAEPAFPHIRLDRALQFLIGDDLA